MVRKILVSATLVSLLGLGFYGCGGLQPEIPPKALSKIEGGKFSIGTLKDIDGNILSDKEIEDALFKYISSLSSYTLANPYKKCFQNLGGGTTCDMREDGVKFSKNENKIKIDYVKGYYIKPSYSISFEMLISISKTADNMTINVQYPTHAVSKNTYFSVAIAEPLDTEEKLISDLENIYKKISNTSEKAFIPKAVKLSGEVNSNYNDSSTYANFERLLGVYSWHEAKPSNVDITKEKYFSFKTADGNIVPLHLKVYPYKNGSKIVYDLEIPYKIYLNGISSFTKVEIENIKKDIAKIAND